jgi:hypothetical protein
VNRPIVRLAVLALVMASATPAAAGQTTTTLEPVEPLVALRYRGTPAGVPVQDELALLRALGFPAVVWAGGGEAPSRQVDRLAGVVGLRVIPAEDPPGSPGRRLTIDLTRESATLLPARAWAAMADGVRLIEIDAGAATGAGVHDAAGDLLPWVRPALALARQVEANGELIARLRPGPAFASPAGSTSPARIWLLDAGRAWVLIAANPAATPSRVAADLPRSVSYGPWVSLVDGHDMSMLVRPAAHEYRATLQGGEARVYVIDKNPIRAPATSW